MGSCLVVSAAALLGACRSSSVATPADAEAAPLAVADDWRALVALDIGATGVWTAEALDVFPQFGGQEVVALDELGRCHVLVQYATKWTDLGAISDGTWLGGVTLAELDPRIDGAELYVGAQTGNVYQLAATREGVLDARLVANVGGQEVHAMTAIGGELVVFTSPGSQWRLAPDLAGSRFTARESSTTGGRVRDIARLADGRFATVSRAGELTVHDANLANGVVALRVESGLGRVAVGAGDVLYSISDDGVVWRSYEDGGAWQSTRIHVGAPGPRGIVAGRFTQPAPREEIALFGYSTDVELLTRAADGSWSARTIFTDRDRGHWLRRAELDQRNGTDELVGSGYGGRVFVLARPPGYGLDASVSVSEPD